MGIDLNGRIMNVVSGSPGSVVNAETIFTFYQKNDAVWAEYQGGRIERGFLVGTLRDGQFVFRYCQRQTDGTIDGGIANCEVRERGGSVQLREMYEWDSREGGGENIYEEIKPWGDA